MFVITQEVNSNVAFMDFPKKGIIEFTTIKKLLGYSKLDIGVNNLKRRKMASTANSPLLDASPNNEADKLYTFEITRFKRMGWQFQIISVVTKDVTFQKNKKAMDLLSTSKGKRNREIKGNVLVLASISNAETVVHPFFLSDYLVASSFIEPLAMMGDHGLVEQPDSPRNTGMGKKDQINGKSNLNTKKDLPGTNTNISQKVVTSKHLLTEPDSFRKDYALNASFRLFKFQQKDDRKFMEYFLPSLSKSLEYVIEQLEAADSTINFAGMKDLFHSKGVNMRYEWIVYSKLTRAKAKAMVGVDIVVRTLKKMLNMMSSKKMRTYKKMWMGLYSTQKTQAMMGASKRDKTDDFNTEKFDLFAENFFKKYLANYSNFLIKLGNEGSQEEEEFFNQFHTNLFINRMRILEHGKKLLENDFDILTNTEVIRELINLPFLNLNLYADALEHHFNLSINYELLRQIRNDKYTYVLSTMTSAFRPTDLNSIFQASSYLTVRERCYTMLLKLLPPIQMSDFAPVEFKVPPSLYKLRKTRAEPIEGQLAFDCYLKDYYELPDLEILNDWVVGLDSVLNGLYTTDGEQNFLLEAYIIQMVVSYFNESDDQASGNILEKIHSYTNGSPVCSPELTIMIHTWGGILSENKLFAECEQSYMMALLTLHKLYGDPRGRGGLAIPWELFITWRLSILCRLQGKVRDAEYIEELFDASMLSLKENMTNEFYNNHLTYNNPLTELSNAKKDLQKKPGPTEGAPKFQPPVSSKDIRLGEHPFTHWLYHMTFDENLSKMDVINSTLTRSPDMLKWIITHMPIFHNTGKIWETVNLRDFYLSMMQSTYANSTSVTSLSNFSMVESKEKSGADGSSTPKGLSFKPDKKQKKLTQGGNLVNVFEKDVSSLSKKELSGIIYSWGQNSDGQVGIPTIQITDDEIINVRKLRLYSPRMVVALKDTIITYIATGRIHSAAVTISGRVLTWGCNKSSQLGLGDKASPLVFIPTPIPNLRNIKNVSCGTEHTVALNSSGQVYSWGQGEGGLLGHGDTKSSATPKLIETFKNMDIVSVVCGGLHTIAVTKEGMCYAWGRGEGGQLGIPIKEQTYDAETNDVYLAIPKRIRGQLEKVFVTQVACGDAHSLALASSGAVFGWGYTNSGQLGLGISGEIYDPNQSLQIREPTVLAKLTNIKITEIFAGSTFSLFMNDKNELYGCGLNDYNQLGLEQSVIRITTGLDKFRSPQVGSSKTLESAVPRKLDCFTSIPILRVSCGENHSLALALSNKNYVVVAWGMQKQGQLGIGDVASSFSMPRTISYLEDVMIYNMACGAYHSMIVLGDATKTFKADAVTDRLMKGADIAWNVLYFENKDNIVNIVENIHENPSEEGKIFNPKTTRKVI
jgi:alpha-tubulin suppressor-like RCC1 family protein